MCFTGLSYLCVCVWTDTFCFLIFGSTAFEMLLLQAVSEGSYSAFCVCVCVYIYSINKWPKTTHTENMMCFCW